jgi:hypothetical protein
LIPTFVSQEFLEDFDDKNRFITSIAVYRSYPLEKQKELINIFFDYVLIFLERQIGLGCSENRESLLTKKYGYKGRK